MLAFLKTLFGNQRPWRGCTPLTLAERESVYHLRAGRHRAAQALRAAGHEQARDIAEACGIRPNIPRCRALVLWQPSVDLPGAA